MATVVTKVKSLNNRIVETMIISRESMLEEGLQELLSRVYKDTKKVVGLELSSAFYTIGIVGKKNKVAVLKLCSGLYCLVIQLIHFNTVPSCLAGFLDLPDITFVGIGIKENLFKLRKDYELECRNGVELGSLAAAEYTSMSYCNAFGLLDMVENVLGSGYSLTKKPASVVFSDWGAGELSEEQIKHATDDAYASFLLGKRLLGERYQPSLDDIVY